MSYTRLHNSNEWLFLRCLLLTSGLQTCLLGLAITLILFTFAIYLYSHNDRGNKKHASLIWLFFITSSFLVIKPQYATLINSFDSNSLVVLGSATSQPHPSSYKLIGASNNYAQYMPWFPCLDGSLIFEFKTHEPNGLLLYTQSLPYKYIQLSLVEGNLRMRMRIGEKDNPRGVFVIFKTAKLNDEKWHEVKINRQNEQTILTIDSGESLYHIHKDASLEGYDLYFGSHSDEFSTPTSTNTQNLLVFGGLPENIQTFDLSLGTALFERPFNGFIRNVRAMNCSTSNLKNLLVTASNNLRYVNEQDACMSSPCLNRGVCLLVDENVNSYRCDCSFTKFSGTNCESAKSSQQSNQALTFTGKEYFEFQADSVIFESQRSLEEEFNIEFKTTRSTGLLIYAGNGQDYFLIGIQDGGVYYKINSKGQLVEKTITIPGTILHNNQWHSLRFTRKFKHVSLVLDNIKRDLNELSADFSALNLPVVYIGGAPKQNTIHRTIYKDYIGCLRNVTLKIHKHNLNLIDLVMANSNQIIFSGRVLTNCQSHTDPVTFTSPDSFIPINTWSQFPELHSFSIEFQTTENFGILAYILGTPSNDLSTSNSAHSPVLSLKRDFFALEIHNRLLNAYFNFGEGYVRFEVVEVEVADGKPHQVLVKIGQDFVTLRFDERQEKTLRIEKTDVAGLSLIGPLVIGGIAKSHRTNLAAKLPPYFFSGMLSHGFVGCVQDVSVNGDFVNLTESALGARMDGLIFGACSAENGRCEMSQCMNEGVCVEGWNRFTCDCSATGFNGPMCNQPAVIATFSEGSYVSIRFEPEWMSEAEHLSLRFKTSQVDKSVLLSTFTPFSNDLMQISIDNSQIKLYVKIGNSETILYSKEGMNDNRWHTIKVLREGLRLIFQVDFNEPSTGMLTQSSAYKGMFLVLTYIEIGSSVYTRNRKNLSFQKNQDTNALAYEKLNLAGSTAETTNTFEGQMQQLLINGKSYFELIHNGDLTDKITSTVKFSRTEMPHKYPLTFHDANSWLALPKIDALHALLVQFHFRTSQPNGLILYNEGQNSDYLAVELVNGQIRYHFSLGGTGGSSVQSKAKKKLDDNEWHLVTIWQATKTTHELAVDSLTYRVTSADSKHNVFNLVGSLYVGGLPIRLMKGKMVAKQGFQGCIASLEVNGRVPDMNQVIRKGGINGQVTQGCESVSQGCQKDTCKNEGVCIEKWEENRQLCNCELTTFTGSSCQDVSLGYFIDRSEIQFEYNNPLYSEDISLVFGFETKSLNALLFKSKSHRTSKTIFVEISSGYVQATVSDGHGTKYFHKFVDYPVNTARYHILRLTVNADNNSTLSIDKLASHKTIISEKSLNYQPVTYTSSGLISLQVGGSNQIDVVAETKEHILKIPSSNTVDAAIEKLLTTTLLTPVERGHLWKTDKKEENNEDETVTQGLSRDHLLNTLDTVIGSQAHTKFIGNIFGLVYNQFRILDLVNQKDSRIRISGDITPLINSQINRDNSSRKDEEGCNNQGLDNKNCGNDRSDTQQIKKILPDTSPDKDYYDYTLTNSQSDSTENTYANKEKNYIMSDTTTSTLPSVQSTEQPYSTLFEYSSTFLTAVILTFFSIVCLMIIAICKYRNRDEGTYTIDESKNCGPFAELDTPLNGSSSSKKSNKKLASNRRKEVVNKEWYV